MTQIRDSTKSKRLNASVKNDNFSSLLLEKYDGMPPLCYSSCMSGKTFLIPTRRFGSVNSDLFNPT